MDPTDKRHLDDLRIVVAKVDADGRAIFVDDIRPAHLATPGVVEAAYLWGTDSPPSLPDAIGEVPGDLGFPLPGGSRFGLVCFPPRSAGRLGTVDQAGADPGEQPGMHRSNTLDYEVVLSGKIDIVLAGGERRTLTPGSCLVMGGAMHAWENLYDEPCIYACILIGARN